MIATAKNGHRIPRKAVLSCSQVVGDDYELSGGHWRLPGTCSVQGEKFMFLDLTVLLGKQLPEPGTGLGSKFSSYCAV